MTVPAAPAVLGFHLMLPARHTRGAGPAGLDLLSLSTAAGFPRTRFKTYSWGRFLTCQGSAIWCVGRLKTCHTPKPSLKLVLWKAVQ